MWHLLDLISRGCRYHTAGVIRDSGKIAAFVDKMDSRFGVLLSPSGRAKRLARGIPGAHLVIYRDWDDTWCWWLLIAGSEDKVKSLADAHGEVLKDAERTDGRLHYRDEYVLRQRQRPRNQGGGRVWTWFLTKPKYRTVEQELVKLAASHGRDNQRTDDLICAVQRLRNRPMFNGIRTQARRAVSRAKRVWLKTHNALLHYPALMDEPLPFFPGRIKLFCD